MPDRLADLVASTTINGIDFVEIAAADQCTLRVHFVNGVDVAGALATNHPVVISGGETVPEVPVGSINATDWTIDDSGRPVLTLRTPYAGDFSWYRLHIDSPALDAYFASIAFTFKAGCPSTLDCRTADDCVMAPNGGPIIDYLAKDFDSFRGALLEYSARTYPYWVERDEPDVGMMLAEVLSAVGDDLSYLQDRIAAEATFATATQRVSMVRHARLVDYEPLPIRSARALLQIDVAGPTPCGLVVQAPQPDGAALPFELGDGLVDPVTGELRTAPLLVDPRWNRTDHSSGLPRIVPHLWDDAQRCLLAGSTETWIVGHGFGFPVSDPNLGTTGLPMLIDTAAVSTADPPVREIVHLTAAIEELDSLYGVEVTHLRWDATEAVRFDHDLGRTVFAGNLVGAVQGQRYRESFVIDPGDGPMAPGAAVARMGPDAGCSEGRPVHLHTLRAGRLAWLAGDADVVTPELYVVQTPELPGDEPLTWRWRRSLLRADLFERAYTVDPTRFADIRRVPAAAPWFEYDGGNGDSVRFGDGSFGDRPSTGSAFDVTYRTTAGAAGNVAADSIAIVPLELRGVLLSVTNPFPARGGAAEEALDHIRSNAPQAFRTRTFRAVRAEDYDAAADELPWVLNAGTSMRWTGSWLTVFTTGQPRGHMEPTLDEQRSLVRQLDRRRLAGYEVVVPNPRFVGLDLVVTVCADASALRGEVEAAVLAALGTGRLCDGRPGFFAPGHMKFGTPLERSLLEAAAQRVTGVHGVVGVWYRRRGYQRDLEPMVDTVRVGRDEIIRVDNDPSEPDHGSLKVVVEGGK
jgi:hypothetical protein